MKSKIEEFYHRKNVDCELEVESENSLATVYSVRTIDAGKVERTTSDLGVFIGRSVSLERTGAALNLVVPTPNPPVVKPSAPTTEGLVYVGETLSGTSKEIDLYGAPHALLAGATGTGKSVLLNTMITGINASSVMFGTGYLPVFVMIDPKGTELTQYKDAKNVAGVYTDTQEIDGVLLGLIKAMGNRFKLLRGLGKRSIDDTIISPIFVVVDEMSDLFMQSDYAMRACIRLAQKARAVGIHLILATQRPSSKIVSGDLKANMPLRIALQVPTATDSRIIIDRSGAERLSGKGRALIVRGNNNDTVQTPYTTDQHVQESISNVNACDRKLYIRYAKNSITLQNAVL